MVRLASMALVFAATTHGSSSAGQMTLDVDATDAPLKMLHARMSMPAKAGPMSLF